MISCATEVYLLIFFVSFVRQPRNVKPQAVNDTPSCLPSLSGSEATGRLGDNPRRCDGTVMDAFISSARALTNERRSKSILSHRIDERMNERISQSSALSAAATSANRCDWIDTFSLTISLMPIGKSNRSRAAKSKYVVVRYSCYKQSFCDLSLLLFSYCMLHLLYYFSCYTVLLIIFIFIFIHQKR